MYYPRVTVVLKKIPVIFPAVAMLALLACAPSSRALEKPKVFRGILLLEGTIVSGDYVKLRNFLSDRSTFDKISRGVFLASPGGNVAEAMQIGRLIRSLRLSTEAPPGRGDPRRLGEIAPDDLLNSRNYGCASACFLIFVSGIYRNENGAGRLGVHRPFRLQSDMKTPVGNEDPVIGIAVRGGIENYLREMNAPAKYADLMFAVPSARVRWITQHELDTDLKGLIPELKDIVDGKCSGSADATSAKQGHDLASCQLDAQWRLRSELPAQAWPKVFGAK